MNDKQIFNIVNNNVSIDVSIIFFELNEKRVSIDHFHPFIHTTHSLSNAEQNHESPTSQEDSVPFFMLKQWPVGKGHSN